MTADEGSDITGGWPKVLHDCPVALFDEAEEPNSLRLPRWSRLVVEATAFAWHRRPTAACDRGEAVLGEAGWSTG